MSVFTILYRNIKWRFHNSFTIVITILQPILWLVLYSAVAGQTMKNTGIENYTAFILPGLVVLVSFSTCSSSGIMNYMMKSDGSFYRVLIAPIKRSSIVLGQLLALVQNSSPPFPSPIVLEIKVVTSFRMSFSL